MIFYNGLHEKISHLENSIHQCSNNIDEERFIFELRNCKNRENICNWIKSKINPRYHITLTPCVNILETNFERCINEFIKMLNYEYFSNRYNLKTKGDNNYNKVKDNNFFFSGVVIREYQINNSVHYHILISDHKVFNWNRNRKKYFDTKVQDKCFRLKSDKKYSNGNPQNIIDVFNGITVQDYYCDKLEEYLTKSLEKNPNNFDFIAPIGINGFAFENKKHVFPDAKRKKDVYYDQILPGAKNVSSGVMKNYLNHKDRMRNLKKSIERKKRNALKQESNCEPNEPQNLLELLELESIN